MNEVLLAVGVTLVVLDFFISSEVASFVAYLLFSVVIVGLVNIDLLYSVALGAAVYGLLLVFHFQVFRALSAVIVDKFISPTKVKSGDDGLVGQTGVVTEISGKRFVRVGDELCRFDDTAGLANGTVVDITGTEQGKLLVRVNNN